jgi:hypothetical protein
MNTTSITAGIYPTPANLITAIVQAGNAPSKTQLELVEQLYQHAGAGQPFKTYGLFGTSRSGPAQITITNETLVRIFSDMTHIVTLNAHELKGDGPLSAVERGLAAIKCSLQRLICILSHMQCTGLTVELGTANAA